MTLPRRQFLGASLAVLTPSSSLLLNGTAHAQDAAPGQAPFAQPPLLAPIQARADRIIDISVCTRPFRAAGPRIEAQRFGRQTVIHNYGHGGAGFTMSWGCAEEVFQRATV